MHKKTIDPITGRMFLKHSLQDDLRDKRVREKATVHRKGSSIASLKDDEADRDAENLRDYIVREVNMDTAFAEFPSSQRREWSIAQAHLIKQRSKLESSDKDGEALEEGSEEEELKKFEAMNEEMAQKVHAKVMDGLQKRQTLVES